MVRQCHGRGACRFSSSSRLMVCSSGCQSRLGNRARRPQHTSDDAWSCGSSEGGGLR